jgi:hypothetical protein
MARRAKEHAGEGRATSEAAQRSGVGQALEHDEQGQRAGRPRGRVLDERRQRRLSREQHVRRALAGHFGEDDGQAADGQADHRRQHHGAALDDGLEHQGQPPDEGADHRRRQTDPDGDQRCFRPEHHPETQGGQRGDDDAGDFDRRNGSTRLEALGRLVAAGSREVVDGESHQEPRHRQREERPPHRLAVEPQVVGKIGEDILLTLVDHLEEEVGERHDGRSDDGTEHQQHQVVPALEELEGVDVGAR